jgi:outer membrane protein assembly factor BamB
MQGYAVREGVMAYGIFFVSGYGGEIIAYSTNNGTVLWKFNDTDIMKYTTGIPWGQQPVHVGAMADGMVFAFAGEHSPGTPLYPGYRNFAVNVTTGEKVWDIFGWSSSGLGTSISPVAIADGYLAMYNCYDGQIYSIGKGPSATTVTASPKVSVHGHSVLVEGTVIDTAAGTKQNEQAARFPNGVPAVSDESMTPWMEYIYQQKPFPQDAVGVNVTISVLDPNGNVYDVGTTTSNTDGTYKLMFTPEVPGEYTVVASFTGSESYWPSHAATAIGVEEAPAATPEPTPIPASIADIYLLPATIGIIVAIAVVGLVIILMLRKR